MKYLRVAESILSSFSFFPFGIQYKGKENFKERLRTLQTNGLKKDREKIEKDWQNVGKDIRKAIVNFENNAQ